MRDADNCPGTASNLSLQMLQLGLGAVMQYRIKIAAFDVPDYGKTLRQDHTASPVGAGVARVILPPVFLRDALS